MKRVSLFVLTLCAFALPQWARAYNSYWQQMANNAAPVKGERVMTPNKYLVYALNISFIKEQLYAVSEDPNQAITLELPAPDGALRAFRVWQTPVMEKGLADRYPDIRTFTAEAIGDRFITAKLNLSPAGFSALVFGSNGSYFIDPLTNIETGYYQCYYKSDCSRTFDWACHADENAENVMPEGQMELGRPLHRTNGTQRKNYRLALACDKEYAQAVGGSTPTKASVLAAMVLIVNRVNGVYERELSVHLTLIANTDTLIFLDNTSPYTDANPNGIMLSQNQTTVTNRIGTANYDIGHVFSTGGGGIASLGSVCASSRKAQGVTGLPNPVGDAFAIDYVAHEMGHQFGGNHTFNTNTGSCGSGNRNRTTAYEPGSGSTIMAYAGICGSGDNLQTHSDAYFHAVSLKEITTYITSGTGGTCPTTTTSSNVPNTIGSITATYSIPFWTPFELTAPAATDATADTLRYCWEEWDLDNSSSGQTWAATSATGPIFRSFLPDTGKTRVFPKINRILLNQYSYLGEKLPSVARALNFILTTRDIYQGWGAFNSSDDIGKITLNAIVTTDTFRVLTPSTTANWNTGTTQSVSWTVAQTDASPISCATVDLFLSVDGGYTYPYTIATDLPNTGSASFTVPNIAATSTQARIKVKGHNNVFFNINPGNFTVTKATSSVGEVAWANAVSMYPVPAHDLLNIKMDGPAQVMSVQVLNALGQVIWKGDMNANVLQIATGAWSKGMYVVMLSDKASGERVARNILVQ